MSAKAMLDDLGTFCTNSNNEVENIFKNAHIKDLSLPTNREEKLKKSASDMLKIGDSYLTKWTGFTQSFVNFEWASLDKTITVEQVMRSYYDIRDYKYGSDKKAKEHLAPVPIQPVDESSIAIELEFVNKYISFFKTNEQYVHTHERWDFIFFQASNYNVTLDNILILLKVILILSPTNSLIESIFSELQFYWSDSKTNISLEAISAYIMIRYNFDCNYEEFIQMLHTDKSFLNSIHSDQKYVSHSKI